jgi:hypothetical protein
LPTLPPARVLIAFLAALRVVGPADARAQSAVGQGQDTREGIIIAQQTDKAAHPPPETRTKPEIVLDYVGKFLTPKPRGFFPVFDSVYAGGSLTLGGGYGWAYGDKSTFAVRGLYSIKNYKLFDAFTVSPGHMNGHLTLFATAGWRNATDAAFYGLGMATSAEERFDFDLKETYARGNAELRNGWSVLKGSVGLEAYVIGPSGTNDHSTEGSLTPEQAPGLGADPTYIHSRATAGIDTRTSPGYTRSGGYYAATFHNFTNTNGPYDFNRLDGDAVQHIPILRETWVLSFHGRVESTLGNDTADTPYFLLPSLGSGSTLRGYSSWRFRDRHALLTQGEFRWIPNRLGMDMAIFYDAGKVAPRFDDLSFKGLAHDWGIGVRFHGPSFTPLRLEVARGSEGVNLVFSGNAAF